MHETLMTAHALCGDAGSDLRKMSARVAVLLSYGVFLALTGACTGLQANPAASSRAMTGPSESHLIEAAEPTAKPTVTLPPQAPPLTAEQDQWSAEEPDRDWTLTTKRYFIEALESENAPPGVLRALDCHKTLCRVELGSDDLRALRALEVSLKTDGYRFSYAFGDRAQVIAFLIRDRAGREQ